MTTSTVPRRSSFLGGCVFPAICCLVFIGVGLAAAPRFYTWWWGLAGAPQTTVQELPTAVIAPRPTTAPEPQDRPAVAAPVAPVATEAPSVSPPAAAPQEPASEIEAPLPAPDEPTFKDSFQPAVCPPVGAYFTPLPGSPCFNRAGQAPLPAVGSGAFVQSFK